MAVRYDKHYQSIDLFGNASPALLEYFQMQPQKGRVLDLGCGQGRDALPLARMGFQVTGVDHSEVGIMQMVQISNEERLGIQALVADIYLFTDFGEYDFVLLDSMFHFNRKHRVKEQQFLSRIFNGVDPGTKIVLCIANTGDKVKVAKTLINETDVVELEQEIGYSYSFVDKESGHSSKTNYCMLVSHRN